MLRALRSRLTVITLLTVLMSGAACAQGPWPDKPIRFVVPFAAGGPVDVIARLLAPPIAEQIGATIVIENRAGAGGNIGIVAVARAETDGATFLVTSGSFVVNPSLYEKVAYDPVTDFEPIIEIATSPNLFVATTASGITSIAALVEMAKRQPGKLSYAGPGVGTQSHFAAELLKVKAGIDMAHVSHNGSGPAVQSMLAGAVQIGVLGLAPVLQHIEAGTLKPLAISSARRWRDLPNLPTMVESGYPDFAIDVTFAMFVPARTPSPIVERMAREAAAALRRQDVQQKMRDGGFDVTALPPMELRQKTAREVVLWKDAVALTGIRIK